MEFVLGAAFVGIYAIDRFGRYTDKEFPPPPWLSTSWFRYLRSLVIYVVWSITLFVILAVVPAAVLIAVQTPVAEAVGLKQTAPPVVVAMLLLTVALSRVRILREVDNKIRGWLRGLAGIPGKALAIRRWILASAHQPRPSDTDACELAAELQPLTGSPVRRRAVGKLVAAASMLRSLNDEHHFVKFAEEQPEQLTELRNRIGNNRTSLLTLSAGQDSPAGTGMENTESGILADVESTHTIAATLMARALLRSAMPPDESHKQMNDLGFSQPREWPRESRDLTDVIALVGILAFVTLLVTLVITADATRADSLKSNPFIKALMISVVYAIAFGVPSLVSYRWVHAQRAQLSLQQTRIGLYAVSAAIAVTADVAVRWVFKFLVHSVDQRSLHLGATEATVDLNAKWAYCMLTLVNALVTAWVLERSRSTPAPPWQRWVEATVYAGLNLGAAMLIWKTLAEQAVAAPSVPQTAFLSVVTGLAFALGLTVPNMYRERVLYRREEHPAAPQPGSAREEPEDAHADGRSGERRTERA